MGKLLTGHYGEEPEAESIAISLTDCNLKLGLKPSDFVSTGAPTFFQKKFGGKGRYLVFAVDPSETKESGIWKPGYYLLPLEAADVLKRIGKGYTRDAERKVLPVTIECEETVPEGIRQRIDQWIANCQPLFFKCSCQSLELKISAPWGLRRRWKTRLRCPDRCQPPLTELF